MQKYSQPRDWRIFMISFLAFIGLIALIWYVSKKLRQFGAWCDKVSEKLLKENQINQTRKKSPVHKDSYMESIREEIENITK